MALSKNRKTKRKQMGAIKKGGKKPVTGLKKKLPFGGYAINFNGQSATVEQVFGKKPIPPSTMTKLIWKYVKANKLGNR